MSELDPGDEIAVMHGVNASKTPVWVLTVSTKYSRGNDNVSVISRHIPMDNNALDNIEKHARKMLAQLRADAPFSTR